MKKKEITREAVIKATGKPPDEWFSIIQTHTMRNSSHKAIANFLHRDWKLSFWWAQEITVLYEKHTGLRVTGQTASAGFQVGVSRTFPAGKETLWNLICSANGAKIIVDDKSPLEDHAGEKRTGKSGVEYKITTFHPGSHLRMQLRFPEWADHSILQIRVTGKAKDKATITFHHEKLGNASVRAEMKQYWGERLSRIGDLLK